MRIDHINIVVEDIEYSKKFYMEVLGFMQTNSLFLEGEWIEAITGFKNSKAKCVFLEPLSKNCRIELLEYVSPKTIKSTNDLTKLNFQGLRHIALEVKDIYSIYEKAKNMGIESFSEPIKVPLDVVPTGKILCYLKAPDNVIFELAQYEKAPSC